MNQNQHDIVVKVDLTNPGQFFACCGLFELVDRLWPGAIALFEKGYFRVRPPGCQVGLHPDYLLSSINDCVLRNTMTDSQVERLQQLKAMKKKDLNAEQKAQKKHLEKLWRETPIVLQRPFCLRIDWFQDEASAGHRFKTWAGQQSVIDICLAMKSAIGTHVPQEGACSLWLSRDCDTKCVPFNFDSSLGPQSASIDVGYSLDALEVSTSFRPMIEFGAFVGLQRFRPRFVDPDNTYQFFAWHQPIPVAIAAAVACGAISLSETTLYDFRLLYRTKYLKSFLPATRLGGLS